MPNAAFWSRNDDGTGIVYGVFATEFFHYTFTTGQYPGGLEEAANRILSGSDPAELPHAELQRFPLSDLTQIRAYRGWTYIDVRHRDAAGKVGEVTLYFNTLDPSDRARELAGAMGRNYRESELRASIFSLLTFPGIVLVVVGFVLGLIYLAASDLEQGKEVPINGRRAILKATFVGIASVLGTKGCLILGGILLLLVVAWIAKKVVAWPRDLVFEFR